MFDPQAPENHRILNKTPVTWIQEICDKLEVNPRYNIMDISNRSECGQTLFTASLAVQKAGFGGATIIVSQTGRTKKIAKQCVAISMLNGMKLTTDDLMTFSKTKILPTPGCVFLSTRMVAVNALTRKNIIVELKKEVKKEVVEAKDKYELETKPMVATDTNSIGVLTSFCLRNGLSRPVFEVESQNGHPQCPTYTVKCTVDAVGLPKPYVNVITETTGLKKIKRMLAKLTLDEVNENPLPINLLNKTAQESQALAAEKMQALRSNTKKRSLKLDKTVASTSGASAPENVLTQAHGYFRRGESAGSISHEFCKVENGEKFGGCMCSKCLDACKAFYPTPTGPQFIWTGPSPPPSEFYAFTRRITGQEDSHIPFP